jgi:isopentenyl diphosphate isomerase/L-lactate dehydrogenase-like FMN-dependent dehydrogenase
MIASTVSSYSIHEISEAGGRAPWFQLYPGADRTGTERLVRLAESAGCRVLVLTVDTPVVGNREGHRDYLEMILSEGKTVLGNFVELGEEPNLSTESMTWNDLSWLCSMTDMKVVVKGIVTREDAEQVVKNGAAGIIVSNHGGRQEESNRGSLECLPEVVAGTNGRIPVLMDGGIRRGTDVFKALALGAHAVCIGRPYMWGLAAFGQAGVERVLEILDEEFIRIQQLSGVPNIADIGRDSITSRLPLSFLHDSS